MCGQKNRNKSARHTHDRRTHHLFLPHNFTASGNSPHRSTTSTHLSNLKNKALLSIGMFCDNGCLALFDDKKVCIIDKRTNKSIMHGTRDNKSTLYMVPLTPEQNEYMTECNIPERHFAGSLYKAKSKADLSTFLHLTCWSRCKSAMITAIKNNFLSTWTGLTKRVVW